MKYFIYLFYKLKLSFYLIWVSYLTLIVLIEIYNICQNNVIFEDTFLILSAHDSGLEAFFKRQHDTQIIIIEDVIRNASKSDLLEIHKCINSKLPIKYIDVSNDNDILFQGVSDIKVVKRFLFWLFWVIVAVCFQEFIWHGILGGNELFMLHSYVTDLWCLIKNDPSLTNELYETLVSLQIIKD